MADISPIRELKLAEGQSLPEAVSSADGPVIIRGLAASWPLVKAAQSSRQELDSYLRKYADDVTVHAFVGDPSIGGRVFYNDDFSKLNFEQIQTRMDWVLQQIEEHDADQAPPTIYMGSTAVDYCLPGMREQNDLDLPGITPTVRIWLGNRSRVAAHYDALENIACVCAGRRRFTLFPPEQLENLYIGPLDFTPAGQAVSLVDFNKPDLEQFPRFAKAMEHASSAELEPGDAIYIPAMWWHHVEGLENLNILVNYWWRPGPAYMGAPNDALMHAIMNIGKLPAEQRAAWRAQFEHYVFADNDGKFEHIPADRRGLLGEFDVDAMRRIRLMLRNNLNR